MYSIQQLTKQLNAQSEGSLNLQIHAVNSLDKAKAGEISYFKEAKFERSLYETNASAVLVPEDFIPKRALSPTLLRVRDVMKSYIELLYLFQSNDIFEHGKSKLIEIADTAELGENVVLGSFTQVSKGAIIGQDTKIASHVFIGENVQLGKEVLIYPGVKIYPNCSIGDRSIIHANAVIGSDGFGYHPNSDGKYIKIPQIGAVHIDEDVEIGANTVVDRSTVGYTHIASGVKLDNLVQVAHNVEIGENTVIAAQTGISGSVHLGKSCVVGGQCAFVPHVKVADGSMFQGKSAVARDIKKSGGRYFGAPAFGFNDYIRSYAIFKQLPDMEKKIRELEKVIKELKQAR